MYTRTSAQKFINYKHEINDEFRYSQRAIVKSTRPYPREPRQHNGPPCSCLGFVRKYLYILVKED